MADYRGILFIGDPHLASRALGFRKDDYPRVILEKLRWCLEYARSEQLLPALLGDLFHQSGANANWLMGDVVELLRQHVVVGIYGNHDCRENELGADDSLMILVKAGALTLLDRTGPWTGAMNGRRVMIGGTSWGRWIPKKYDRDETTSLVVWLTHHDVKVPGYEDQGRFDPREIPGIDLVVNGHIHRRLDDVQKGQTLWITPGNISRISRSDINRGFTPSVLRLDVTPDGFARTIITVPHRPFDEVFHEELVTDQALSSGSDFIKGLAELQSRRTATGAGLRQFLDLNVPQLPPEVAAQIMSLAKEVLDEQPAHVE